MFVGEHFISNSCICFVIFNALRLIFKNSFFFSLKKLFFQNFDWSNLFFDQSKFCFKIYVSLCLVRLIKPVFRSIEDRISSFLKQFFDCFKNIFFKKFFNFSSLSDLARQHITFLSFSSSIFARFSSLKAGKTILSLLFVLFSCFHAFRGYFQNFWVLGFLMIQGLFSEINHWVLMGYCYIHDWCWLIWSIWGFMKNWKF